MPQYLRRLFDHLAWADARALDSLWNAPVSPEVSAARERLAHILGAEHVWLARLQERAAQVAVWPALTLEECAALGGANHAGYAALLDSFSTADLDRTVRYTNSAGQVFDSRIEDILLHVAMHGSYHRGQVALLVRQSGATPFPTDYIGFVRGVPAATRV